MNTRTPTPLYRQKVRYRLVWNHARRLNRRGEGLVQVEVQQGRRRRYVSTHTYLPPDNWRDGWVVGTPDDNARNFALRRMVWEMEQVELEYIKKGMTVTLPSLMDAIRTNVNPAARLRDFTMQVMVNEGDRRENTKAGYRSLLNDIDRFRTNTYLTDIDYQWVMDYEQYLKALGVAQNTRISRLRQLRAIVNEAYRRDLVAVEPFKRIRLEKMVAKKGHLTLPQLHAIERMRLTGKEERARDLFLLAVYSGLRFSDVVTLRQEHISDGWLHKKTIKTGAVVDVPVGRLFNGSFMEIIKKYNGDIGLLTRKHIGNSEVNRLLKPLLQRVKADPKVTFHSARHTFATLLQMKGVGLETVQRMLGHTDIHTTQIYAEAAHDTRADIERGLRRLFRE